LMLGLITNGQTGIGPLSPNDAGPRWFGLLQLLLAGSAAWLALQAWRPRPVRRENEARNVDAEGNPVPLRPVSGVARLQESVADRWRVAREEADARWRGSVMGRSMSRASEWLERARAWSLRDEVTAVQAAPSQSFVSRVRNRFSKPPTVSKTPAKKRARLPRIRFMGSIEHRCPYCLDVVEPDDPRGIEVCEICHTYHHADCWAVTGMCQVPHHHTEIKVSD
jgi:hypothetical protein